MLNGLPDINNGSRGPGQIEHSSQGLDMLHRNSQHSQSMVLDHPMNMNDDTVSIRSTTGPGGKISIRGGKVNNERHRDDKKVVMRGGGGRSSTISNAGLGQD